MKSNKNFNKNEILKCLSCCTFPDAALLPCFSMKSIWLQQVFLEGHLRNISTKLSWNRTSRLWRKRILKFGYNYHCLMPQQPKFYTECKSLSSFERRPTKEHSCEVKLKLVHWNGTSWLSFVAKSSIYPFCDDAWLLWWCNQSIRLKQI